MITERAYAKINLSLDVTGKFPNGYHTVRMIMQTVDIYDTLTFEKADSGITIDVGGSELPVDKDNLIYRAADALLRNNSSGVHITLEKHIPIAAGMAGGSSDAAATLRGINRLFELGLSFDELREIGVKIGADVPYCIEGGTVLAEGIGEKLTPLSPLPEYILAVAKPKKGVSTGNVYKSLDEIFDGISHPDVDAMLNIIRTIGNNDRDNINNENSTPNGELKVKNDDGTSQGIKEEFLHIPEQLMYCMGNVLEYVTVPLCPEINDIKDIFRKCKASGTLMTGSGPTVFAFYEDEENAFDAIKKIRQADLSSADESFVTKLKSFSVSV